MESINNMQNKKLTSTIKGKIQRTLIIRNENKRSKYMYAQEKKRNSSAYNFFFFLPSAVPLHTRFFWRHRTSDGNGHGQWSGLMTSLTGSVYRQTCVTCIIRFSVYIENHLLLPCLETVMELLSLFLSLSHCMF